ncbi:OadG family protein [Tuanshanicoccus lijuaniae]|uniref:OadG family protein n=1 Tax=Aerococcaceae bacterium zg-1292 TaxID=2774330 RepID=UPI00193578E2|nr:OadG family protein [Aerococcaceae bacterium zg-1292]MBF6626174.1 OadG family protein [Aerococcaceae bacterium zg-BR9]MBF6978034.1 OadG family protein [Aerococcaceae bacterium zg-BR22]MBS4456059.1 OadG family protein [Aerococcaceae bacterium zg-A91]MBS4457811.1 OadG family protein [Aerococcaceae bacterium zg-BR33]
MGYSIIDIINLTFSAITIVFIVLTAIMFSIKLVGQIVEKFEQQTVSESSAANMSAPVSVPKEKTLKEMFDEDSYAQVAALVALTQASEDEQDKRFEVASIVKK